MTIFSKFWSRDYYPICIHGSRSRCFTCITEQVTSEVVDMFSRGGRPLDCHFANTSVEMANFVRSAVQLRRQCFINPWIQTALFLINAIAATSAAVNWQFAGWISPIPPPYIPPLLTKYGVYNAVKCFSRNKLLFQLWIATVWGRIYPTKLRCPNIAHDPRCLKTSQNTSIADSAAITRWPL